jgi:His/Glu/Gln/Arg/opine family amino acid ABC transporter permease subunit
MRTAGDEYTVATSDGAQRILGNVRRTDGEPMRDFLRAESGLSMRATFDELLAGASATIVIAASAWIVAAVLGLVLAVVANIGPRVIRQPLKGLILVLRSIPELIVFYFGLGALGLNIPPFVAAALGLGIATGAYAAEYYRGALMTVPPSQVDAGKSLGLSALGVMRLVVIPQAFPVVVPPLANAFIGLLKNATLASAVGAPEILYRARNVISRTGDIGSTVMLVVLMYVVATLPLTRLVAILERRIQGQMRGHTEALRWTR